MPKVLLFRGIPGSGKTTWSTKYYPVPSDYYFSTDLFWMKDGEYKFDPTRLGEAHSWNFRRFLSKLNEILPRGSSNLLIVDNTNITREELIPYVRAAEAYQLEFKIITIWCDPIVAIKRNEHGVPAHTVLKMYAKLLNEELPAYWKQTTILNP